jgi:gas vesicle protein
MSDEPMPQEDTKSQQLKSEFEHLGDNLRQLFVNAWESEERKNFQDELERGLTDLGDSLKQTAKDFQESETGQQVKAEAEDLRDRIASGEVEQKVREDILSVLHKVNAELEKITKPEPEDPETE